MSPLCAKNTFGTRFVFLAESYTPTAGMLPVCRGYITVAATREKTPCQPHKRGRALGTDSVFLAENYTATAGILPLYCRYIAVAATST